MTHLAQSLREINKPWQWIAIGLGTLLIWVIVASTMMNRASEPAMQATRDKEVADSYLPQGGLRETPVSRAEVAVPPSAAKAAARVHDGLERKIVRTSSLQMVVQHPAEVADRIAALAESLGGYLESSNSGDENANSGTLTIRVPANEFEKAQAEIRKLAVRVESEKVDAQDVTRQYVDQDARIRNLRAEEAGYLFILKQAKTVKDMLAVSQPLSEVRGEIEQQQAEFNALSRQVETVAIAITLRKESEPQGFGLSWHPGNQLRLALHDGLESVAAYATTMTAILFYLPATLLWVATIVLGVSVSWRIVRWGKRWLPAKPVDSAKA